jgi:hypothetical protein
MEETFINDNEIKIIKMKITFDHIRYISLREFNFIDRSEESLILKNTLTNKPNESSYKLAIVYQQAGIGKTEFCRMFRKVCEKRLQNNLKNENIILINFDENQCKNENQSKNENQLQNNLKNENKILINFDENQSKNEQILKNFEKAIYCRFEFRDEKYESSKMLKNIVEMIQENDDNFNNKNLPINSFKDLNKIIRNGTNSYLLHFDEVSGYSKLKISERINELYMFWTDIKIFFSNPKIFIVCSGKSEELILLHHYKDMFPNYIQNKSPSDLIKILLKVFNKKKISIIFKTTFMHFKDDKINFTLEDFIKFFDIDKEKLYSMLEYYTGGLGRSLYNLTLSLIDHLTNLTSKNGAKIDDLKKMVNEEYLRNFFETVGFANQKHDDLKLNFKKEYENLYPILFLIAITETTINLNKMVCLGKINQILYVILLRMNFPFTSEKNDFTGNVKLVLSKFMIMENLNRMKSIINKNVGNLILNSYFDGFISFKDVLSNQSKGDIYEFIFNNIFFIKSFTLNVNNQIFNENNKKYWYEFGNGIFKDCFFKSEVLEILKIDFTPGFGKGNSNKIDYSENSEFLKPCKQSMENILKKQGENGIILIPRPQSKSYDMLICINLKEFMCGIQYKSGKQLISLSIIFEEFKKFKNLITMKNNLKLTFVIIAQNYDIDVLNLQKNKGKSTVIKNNENFPKDCEVCIIFKEGQNELVGNEMSKLMDEFWSTTEDKDKVICFKNILCDCLKGNLLFLLISIFLFYFFKLFIYYIDTNIINEFGKIFFIFFKI